MSLNQKEHGEQNWGTLSQDWPQTNEYPYEKWVFANKSKLIPYGSYVLMEKNVQIPCLRVESQELLDLLDMNFYIVRETILGNMFSRNP